MPRMTACRGIVPRGFIPVEGQAPGLACEILEISGGNESFKGGALGSLLDHVQQEMM